MLNCMTHIYKVLFVLNNEILTNMRHIKKNLNGKMKKMN